MCKPGSPVIYGSYSDHYEGFCRKGIFIKEEVTAKGVLVCSAIKMGIISANGHNFSDIVYKRQYVKDCDTNKIVILERTIGHGTDDKWAEEYE